MLKRPKVINISLNAERTAKNSPTQSYDKLPQSQKVSQHHEEIIIKDIFRVVQIINEQKTKVNHQLSRFNSQSQKFFKKADQEETIRIPLQIIDSLELILRKFLMFKAEQKQQQLRNYSSKSKFVCEKKHLLLNPYNKENTEGSASQPQVDIDIFKTMAMNSHKKQKIVSKIQQMQYQLQLLRQKLSEKNKVISKMQSRQAQIKRKYDEEMGKIMRYKNIQNISISYEKGMEEVAEKRYVLNVNGTHLARNTSRKHIQTSSRQKMKKEPQKFSSIYLKNSINIFKNTIKKESLLNTTDSISRTYKLSKKPQQKDKLQAKTNPNELAALIKQKEVAVDLLNENNCKLVKQIQQLEQMISQKNKVQTLKNTVESRINTKSVNDEDFDALELNGFYNLSENRPILTENP